MGILFEAFIRNFLHLEQDAAWLPEMQTGVVMSSPWQRTVIETESYAIPHQSHHGRKKLISGHLYQLLTYLRNLDADGGPRPSGILDFHARGQRTESGSKEAFQAVPLPLKQPLMPSLLDSLQENSVG
jgi:hypothetical protein